MEASLRLDHAQIQSLIIKRHKKCHTTCSINFLEPPALCPSRYLTRNHLLEADGTVFSFRIQLLLSSSWVTKIHIGSSILLTTGSFRRACCIGCPCNLLSKPELFREQKGEYLHWVSGVNWDCSRQIGTYDYPTTRHTGCLYSA